ncbi:hypothetical protein AB2S62_09755 [Vibrio sp. NTOU-M3]|uniref:hypothetical protein n=1 Tax=Vibrio sp. NTOU-M3 TaxID=3234954 RepID=UPI00349FA593
MTVRKLKDGSKKPWLYECYLNGRAGKRIRKHFATKGEANAYELYLMKKVDDKPWLGAKSEKRSLLDMIDLWQERHGQSLAHSKYTYNKLKVIALAVDAPLYT